MNHRCISVETACTNQQRKVQTAVERTGHALQRSKSQLACMTMIPRPDHRTKKRDGMRTFFAMYGSCLLVSRSSSSRTNQAQWMTLNSAAQQVPGTGTSSYHTSAAYQQVPQRSWLAAGCHGHFSGAQKILGPQQLGWLFRRG